MVNLRTNDLGCAIPLLLKPRHGDRGIDERKKTPRAGTFSEGKGESHHGSTQRPLGVHADFYFNQGIADFGIHFVLEPGLGYFYWTGCHGANLQV